MPLELYDGYWPSFLVLFFEWAHQNKSSYLYPPDRSKSWKWTIGWDIPC